MSRVYNATFDNIAVSAVQDMFEILAPSDSAVEIVAIDISDRDSETSEQGRVVLIRGEGSVTSGSGGSTVTPAPMSKGDPAFGGTVERNNTTAMVAGSGTLVTLGSYGFNWLSGFQWVKPGDECGIYISPGDRLAINLPVAPGSARNVCGVVTLREIGG